MTLDGECSTIFPFKHSLNTLLEPTPLPIVPHLLPSDQRLHDREATTR